MSTYHLWGYNYLIIPKFDVLLRLESGKNIYMRDKYMRYFVLFGFVCGLKTIYDFFRKIGSMSLRLLNESLKSLPTVEVRDKYVVVLGFGDSQASISLVKSFSKLGFNCIVLNYKNIIDLRVSRNVNETEGIDSLDTDIIQMSYEDFIESFNDKIKISENSNVKMKIEYIIDATVMGLPAKENKDKSSVALDKNELYKNLNIFFEVIEIIKNQIKNCSVILIEYARKYNETVKIIFDMKFSMANTIRRLNATEKKIKYIKRAKIINSQNKLNDNLFYKLFDDYEQNIIIG